MIAHVRLQCNGVAVVRTRSARAASLAVQAAEAQMLEICTRVEGDEHVVLVRVPPVTVTESDGVWRGRWAS